METSAKRDGQAAPSRSKEVTWLNTTSGMWSIPGKRSRWFSSHRRKIC